jgi:hypothetical protein
MGHTIICQPLFISKAHSKKCEAVFRFAKLCLGKNRLPMSYDLLNKIKLDHYVCGDPKCQNSVL